MKKFSALASALVFMFASLTGVTVAYADENDFGWQAGTARETVKYTNYKATKFGKSGIVLTLQNGSFKWNGDGFDVLGESGEVLESIGSELVTENGGKATLKFTSLGKKILFVKYEVVENPVYSAEERGYWSYVGKNAVGGLVGGAAAGCATGIWFGGLGCLPGAKAGATTGAIATGVGSLIWCW